MTEDQLSSLIFEVSDLCRRNLDMNHEEYQKAMTRNGLEFSVDAVFSDEWTPPEEMPRIRGFCSAIKVVAHSPALVVFDDGEWIEHGPWETLAPKVLQELQVELLDRYKEKVAQDIATVRAAALKALSDHEKLVRDAAEALTKIN